MSTILEGSFAAAEEVEGGAGFEYVADGRAIRMGILDEEEEEDAGAADAAGTAGAGAGLC